MGFEQNYVIWGMSTPKDCLTYMMSDVWWFSDVLDALTIAGVTLSTDYILALAKTRYSAIFSASYFLAFEITVTSAIRECLSWCCKHPRQAPCNCVTAGYIADTWQCTCNVGSMILNDPYKEFYQTSPPTGENSVFNWQLRS